MAYKKGSFVKEVAFFCLNESLLTQQAITPFVQKNNRKFNHTHDY